MKCVLQKLMNPEEFKKVYIDQEAGTVAWSGEIHIDADTLYNRGLELHDVEKLSRLYNDLKNNGQWKDII